MLLKKQNKIIDIDKFIKKFKQTFSDNFYFEIQRINNPDIKDFENDFINIAHQYSLPIYLPIMLNTKIKRIILLMTHFYV